MDFLRKYTSGTEEVVKIPLTDSIYLNILQVLEFKFVKINKRGGVQIRSGGDGKNFKKLISGGDVYKAPKSNSF